jgi:pyrroline-5-carboxylate reductase
MSTCLHTTSAAETHLADEVCLQGGVTEEALLKLRAFIIIIIIIIIIAYMSAAE